MQRKTPSGSNVAARLHRGLTLPIASLAMAGVLCVSSEANAQSTADLVGLTSLIQRVGAGNQPTGAGVVVGQVEPDVDGINGSPFLAYPDSSLPAFEDETFIAASGPADVSWHANIVGDIFYSVNSIAPGISTIHTYAALGWVQGDFLQTATGGFLPNASPAGLRVFNNSWIGDFGSFNDEVLRRADFVADHDDVLFTNGVNNDNDPQLPLMTYGYNGLAVGMRSGTHTSGLTTNETDGQGRQKPDIVAPGGATSWATPVVGAAAALMYQVAQSAPLLSNLNARKSETIKAILLAGAMHSNLGEDGQTGWNNNPATSGPTRGITATPLDAVYGAGLVNVDRSHRILSGSEQNGSVSVPATRNITAAGWDFASLNAGGVLHYRFRLSQPVSNISILTTWHRTVPTDFGMPSVSNFDLTLKRINASGAAISIVGDAGLPYFGGGNVVSQSAVDNLEHLHLTNVAAGDYVIELRRQSGGETRGREVAIAWIMPVTSPPGDANGDGLVNVTDLLAVISAWGVCPNTNNCPADFNNDDLVNVTDLLTVISNWG